ncbi:MAG TPA: GGDEF domain-containing protein [Armatimonadota bacterium]
MIDITTLFICTIMVNGVLCGTMALYGRTQKTYPGFWVVTASAMLLALGFFLLALRGQLADFWTIVVANSLIVSVWALRLEGLKRFLGITRVWWVSLALPLLVFTALTYGMLTGNNAVLRSLIVSLTMLAFTCIVSWLLLTHARDESRLVYRAFVALNIFFALIITVRCLCWIFLPENRTLYAATPANAWYFLLRILFDIGWVMSIILLNGQRTTLALKRMQARLEIEASTDFLTGVQNRRKFIQRGEGELARARRYRHPLSVLMLDLDNFKELNDFRGHAAGDFALQQVVRCAQSCLRQSDAFGRIGGDEFAILLPDTPLAAAHALAERLQQAMTAQPIAWNAQPLRLSLSIGAAELTPQDADLDELLLRADAALYAEKREKRLENCMDDDAKITTAPSC